MNSFIWRSILSNSSVLFALGTNSYADFAGRQSFSTLYTAINTLSGHYASYGNKYPVPEKRRVRLQQQYKEIERALARGK